MTKARRTLLAILKEATQPLAANHLIEHPHVTCNQATVYRSLHYLEEKGYIDSFVLRCNGHVAERYYSYRKEDGGHSHWFHCTECHCFIDLGECAMEEQIAAWEQHYRFFVCDHFFSLTGICERCKASTDVRD
jgi:Fur family ferric uptake transcriptional regulator